VGTFHAYSCLLSELGGDRSGASQAHKHLQFLPTEAAGPPVEQAARQYQVQDPSKPFTLPILPYAHHILRLPPVTGMGLEQLGDALCQCFMTLLDLVIASVRQQPEDFVAKVGPPSYNCILTLEHMHLIPRRQETHVLKRTNEKLSINSLGFAGLLLVKCDEELEAVRSEGIREILNGVGMTKVDVSSTTIHEADLEL